MIRSGYTTGACAAAAAKAAALALLTGDAPQRVSLLLPAGVIAQLAVARCQPDGDGVCCSVVKDAGDDPDVTHGAEIRATVRRAPGGGVKITGGPGVGVVTKPGLELPVGSPAINPVPRRMIETAVREVAAQGGFSVAISVPGGEELARRTLNARLGIIGGISILGTTGIVKPFSHEAYTATITAALDVARAAGCRTVALTTGRRTERHAMQWLALPEEAFVEMGDCVGFALQACRERGFAEAVVVAMVGKMVKIAAGHAYTHAAASGLELDVLATAAQDAGASPDLAAAISQAHTAREAAGLLLARGESWVFHVLCAEALRRCQEHLGDSVRVSVLLSGYEGELLGRVDADA